MLLVLELFLQQARLCMIVCDPSHAPGVSDHAVYPVKTATYLPAADALKDMLPILATEVWMATMQLDPELTQTAE